jgi:predicted extracellular nuclease
MAILVAMASGCANSPTPPAVATVVELAAPPADWTALAGRRVRITVPLTVVDTFPLAEHGELPVAFGGRLPVPTEVAAPGAAAKARAEANRQATVVLDDGRDDAPLDAAEPLPAVPGSTRRRAGTELSGVEGEVRLVPGGVRLMPARATVVAAPRPPAPAVPGALRLASFNVLNLFNGDGRGGGFPTPRGAKTPAQLVLQQAKLVASVQALAPDAAALMEIENDGYGPDSALAQFVAALNAAGPIRDYRFVDAGAGPGTNPIRVAIVYRASRLAPRGRPAMLAGGPFGDRSRVPLAQAFRGAGAPRGAPAFVLVANHLKSKGCGRGVDAATGADADPGDGQSCWNALRVASARRLDAWLRTDPTRSGSDRIVLLGDFNAYAQEDPLRVLREAGWVDAFDRFPEPGLAYSFVFDGAAGRLDHALLSPAAAARLRGAAPWHNNADEPDASRYESGRDATPYGASDHDPLVIGLDGP